jgi:hypothetical protein
MGARRAFITGGTGYLGSAALERLPATAESTRRLAMCTLPQMTAALLQAIERPPADDVRIVTAAQIRADVTTDDN